MKARAVIHINGQDYDASSGKALNQKSTEHAPKAHALTHNGITHAPKPPHAHHVPVKSITLSRAGVKKPKIFSDIRHTPIVGITPPASTEHIPGKHAPHSPKVMHFAKIEPRMIDTTPSPEVAQSYPDSPPPIIHHRSRSKVEEHIKRQLSAATAHQAVQHKKPKAHRKHKKASVLASAMAAITLISGFIVYQSLPGLSVDFASERAGFSALVPKYTPGGFKLNKDVAYSPGRVVLSFKSNTDSRQYQIEQQTSNLSSAQLENQIKDESSGQYQTFSAGGLSVFFSNNTAKWSKDGVLFSLTGESGLSSSQIASIASSL